MDDDDDVDGCVLLEAVFVMTMVGSLFALDEGSGANANDDAAEGVVGCAPMLLAMLVSFFSVVASSFGSLKSSTTAAAPFSPGGSLFTSISLVRYQ